MKWLKFFPLLTLLVPTLLMAEGEENHVAIGTRP